jgi:hypothetical protein
MLWHRNYINCTLQILCKDGFSGCE